MCFYILCYVKDRLHRLGGFCEGGTPDPISNSEVKPFSSNDTPFIRRKVGRRQDNAIY